MTHKPSVESAEALRDPRALLADGLAAQRAGRIEVAFDHYASALETTNETDAAVRSEALRRLAVLHNLWGESDVAEELGEQAYQVAMGGGAKLEAGEALNALAGFAFECGHMVTSASRYEHAKEFAQGNPELLLRIHHNLGILENVRGDRSRATAHFGAALSTAERIGDTRQAAMANHNLGMICVDLEQYFDAQVYFEKALVVTRTIGDRHLEGLCHLNLAEVQLRQGRSANALAQAEDALAIFDALDSRRNKAAVYRILGMVHMERGRPSLAEAKLASAVTIAQSSGCTLSEAEARRELGVLYRRVGRRKEAASQLDKAYALFGTMEARLDQEDVRHLMGTVFESA